MDSFPIPAEADGSPITYILEFAGEGRANSKYVRVFLHPFHAWAEAITFTATRKWARERRAKRYLIVQGDR